MFVDLTLALVRRKDDSGDDGISGRDRDIMSKGHYGTHLDRHLEQPVPLDYFKSRGLAFDVSAFCHSRPILAGDVSCELLEPGDFAVFHTGALLRNPYGSKAYMGGFIEFSWELIDSLLERRVRFIGLDARGLRMNAEHAEADIRCEKTGAFVIENLANTQQLPFGAPFIVYAASFDTNGTGIPCRVIAEIPGP